MVMMKVPILLRDIKFYSSQQKDMAKFPKATSPSYRSYLVVGIYTCLYGPACPVHWEFHSRWRRDRKTERLHGSEVARHPGQKSGRLNVVCTT